jgi:hypothetical protein
MGYSMSGAACAQRICPRRGWKPARVPFESFFGPRMAFSERARASTALFLASGIGDEVCLRIHRKVGRRYLRLEPRLAALLRERSPTPARRAGAFSATEATIVAVPGRAQSCSGARWDASVGRHLLGPGRDTSARPISITTDDVERLMTSASGRHEVGANVPPIHCAAIDQASDAPERLPGLVQWQRMRRRMLQHGRVALFRALSPHMTAAVRMASRLLVTILGARLVRKRHHA